MDDREHRSVTVSNRSSLSRAAGYVAACAVVGVAALGLLAHGSAYGGTTPLDRQTVGGAALAAKGVVVHYPSRSAFPLPRVPSSAYVVADANTGQVLAAKDPHGLFLPASTIKVLTAVTLIPLLNPNATVVASPRAANVPPSKVGLVAGRRYKVSDLFKALLLVSANDAAVALTQATGSYSRGIALMNAEAHRLQAYDITVKDPNGLNAPGQYVSAYDLALVARRALAMPAFMSYDSLHTARFPVTPRKSVTLYNQNNLLTGYPGGIGGKIGWTYAAGATYIGLAHRNGVTLIVTILHCTPLTEVSYAERLLDWGFAMDGKVTPVGRLVDPLPSPSTSHATSPTAKPTPARRTSPARAAPTGRVSSGWLDAVMGLIAAAAVAAIVLLLLRRRSAAR